jgi:hypothetical protein
MSDDTQTADRVWVQDKVIVDEETRLIVIINKKLVNPVQYSMRFARQVGHHTERKISNFIPVFVRAGACLSMEETLLRLLRQAEQYIAEQTSANLLEKS